MRVSEVRKKGNNVMISFYDGQDLLLPYDIFIKYYFAKEDELSSSKIKQLELDAEKYRIKQSCFRYLSGRNHSRFELYRKLIKKKYSSELINESLNDLSEQKFINDRDFAHEYFIVQSKKKKGVNKIRSELINRGIDRNDIDEVIIENEDPDIQYDNALTLAKKKYSQLSNRKIDKSKYRQILYQFLASKGYKNDIIKSVILDLNLESL